MRLMKYVQMMIDKNNVKMLFIFNFWLKQRNVTGTLRYFGRLNINKLSTNKLINKNAYF